MNEPRDTLVGDALRRLDVPDHAPDFWERLDALLLDGGTAAVDRPVPDDGAETSVVDLHGSPAAQRAARHDRTPMLALAAAVAVVVALVVGVAVFGGGGDDESQLDVADDATETPETSDPELAPPPPEDDSSTETTAPPETTTTTVVPSDELAADAEETAAEWIAALGTGDVGTAYELLDDESRADLDRAQFEELSSGLAEGAAAFGAAGIERDVTALQPAEGVLHVVTFTGDVQREGMIETAAYPVVVTGTGVHFALDGPQVELDPEYAQSSGTTLAPPLEVLVSDTADTWLWVDDDDPERFLAGGELVLSEEALGGAGTHIATIVAIEGGRITARSYTVVVP